MVAVADADADGEFAATTQVDFASEGQISIGGGAEFPIHPEVVCEVLPAITGS